MYNFAESAANCQSIYHFHTSMKQSVASCSAVDDFARGADRSVNTSGPVSRPYWRKNAALQRGAHSNAPCISLILWRRRKSRLWWILRMFHSMQDTQGPAGFMHRPLLVPIETFVGTVRQHGRWRSSGYLCHRQNARLHCASVRLCTGQYAEYAMNCNGRSSNIGQSIRASPACCQ